MQIQPTHHYTPLIEEEEDKIEFNKFELEPGHDSHRTGSFFTGFISITCIVAGTGTLGLPHAFALGGWLSLLIVLLSYVMAVYSGIILIECLYHQPGQRLADYKAVGLAAFGWPGYCIVSILHWLSLFGCPALYLVLASSNLHYLTQTLTVPVWTVLIGLLLLIPSLMAKTLKEITVLSATGATCTLIAVLVVLVQAPMDRTEAVTDGVIWTGFPSALATIAFSYGGINTYPHVEQTLERRGDWRRVMMAGMTVCTILYVLTGTVGYWAYGRTTVSPIYNALKHEGPKLIGMVVMTVHVILAIPIFTTSFSLECESFLDCREERIGVRAAWWRRAVIRTGTMGLLVMLAIYVPFFDDFMALIGALCNCGLVFVLPVMCYLRLTGWDKPWYELGFCALTVVLGVVGCVFGTIDGVRALARDFSA